MMPDPLLLFFFFRVIRNPDFYTNLFLNVCKYFKIKKTKMLGELKIIRSEGLGSLSYVIKDRPVQLPNLTH